MDTDVAVAIITAGSAALIGAISYAGRALVEWRREEAQQNADIVARLQALAVLLRTSGSIYESQAALRNRLSDLVNRRLESQEVRGIGYEAKFTRAYDSFTDVERELHALIRSMTQNAVRPVNLAISEWLSNDSTFKTAVGPLRDAQKMSEWLHQLELHLTLWHAKYEYWITDERHALVYLADEEDHGVPFPKGIEGVVDDALTELGQPTLNTIPVKPKTLPG